MLYRLGKQAASGILTITPGAHSLGRGEVFVLRRGGIVLSSSDELARRALHARLVRLVVLDGAMLVFEGGVAVAPPGIQHLVSLAAWTRQHLEAQLDNTLADRLLRSLAGIRLTLRGELAPEANDDSDRRMLAAMAQPRRLDQIWPLARTPRFRLLAFVHFLQSVDAIEIEGVVAEQSQPHRIARGTIDPNVAAARRMLGVTEADPVEVVKRAYRRLARAVHPDLQPGADHEKRRSLERKFAEITAAYEVLSA